MRWSNRLRALLPALLPAASRAESRADFEYLCGWARGHTGVEAYVEPPTTVTPMTVVLVAKDGEWTRRRVAGAAQARRLGVELEIPVYDVRRLGYPQRMRDHQARQRILRERERRREW